MWRCNTVLGLVLEITQMELCLSVRWNIVEFANEWIHLHDAFIVNTGFQEGPICRQIKYKSSMASDLYYTKEIPLCLLKATFDLITK